MLPVIVLPFMSLIFWLLGGGTGSVSTVAVSTGLNTQLPDAKFNSQSMEDKMRFYAQADADSVKKKEQERMDPNIISREVPVSSSVATDDRVQSLRKMVSAKPVEERRVYVPEETEPLRVTKKPAPDPEMEAINGTLEKILDIQHPERLKERIPEHKREIFSVSSFTGEKPSTGFYSADVGSSDTSSGDYIPAVVHAAQTVVDGNVIKLRLLKDVWVAGEKIPAGSFVYGTVSFNNERIKVVVASIQSRERIYPVQLDAFDMDGMEGIYIPGSVSRDVVKKSMEQGVQSVGVLSVDQSLKSQAAAAITGAAKSLLSKKAKQVQVMIKSGYRLLLYSQKK